MWDLTVFVFVWIYFFRIMPSRSIYVLINGRSSFFVWLNSISLYIFTTTSLSIHPLLDPLGCLHVLATVNNAAVNKRVHLPLKDSVFMSFDKYPKWNCWITWHFSFQFFWRHSILFSRTTLLMYSPTNRAQVFSFLHIHTSICYLLSFLWWPF